MRLAPDTARHLRHALDSERLFVDAVAGEIAACRIGPKLGEKLILHWYQNRPRVEFEIAWALDDEQAR